MCVVCVVCVRFVCVIRKILHMKSAITFECASEVTMCVLCVVCVGFECVIRTNVLMKSAITYSDYTPGLLKSLNFNNKVDCELLRAMAVHPPCSPSSHLCPFHLLYPF